jgi:hypothetical protein
MDYSTVQKLSLVDLREFGQRLWREPVETGNPSIRNPPMDSACIWRRLKVSWSREKKVVFSILL